MEDAGLVKMRVLAAGAGERARPIDSPFEEPPAGGWVWIDLTDVEDADELLDIESALRLDPLAVRDAIDEQQLPKVDDLDHHLVVVLHGLRRGTMDTYELDCLLTADRLVTIHRGTSSSLDALWQHCQRSAELTSGGPAELLGRLADPVTRRLYGVVELLDDRIEELTRMALDADPALVADLTAVRADLARVRRILHPQRETLDLLRRSPSDLVSDSARRRFSDVFDVADRTALAFDAARSALSETLEAYRGAEARQATEVTKVLTIYAAIMLPLSLIAGFFGMNVVDLPGMERSWAWIAILATMLVITLLSLGMFVALDWIRPLSGRRAGAALGRGLIEVTKTPVQLVGALYEVSKTPLRVAPRRRTPTTDPSRSRARRLLSRRDRPGDAPT